MDTGGKDGTIRRVFEGVNPQGVRVTSFKAPTPNEMDHDYLWRIHQSMPARGEMVIFNRSHYEDVLVVRVHELVAPEVWKQRFDQINAFEKMLSEEGTTILKFYLHISPEEQKQRLLDRLKDETKQWKFNPGDLKERQLWKNYMQAYQEVLNLTSTDYAPWFIVPADKKWYRDWVVATTIIDTLKNLDMAYPKPIFDVKATLKDFDSLTKIP
jgi:PPK2 family polyphosphate:nucleotide phosphotransferase